MSAFVLWCVALAVAHPSASPPSAPVVESPSKQSLEPPSLTLLESLSGGPVAFHPSDGTLAHGRGNSLRVRAGTGDWQSVSVPSEIVDLAYGPNGTLYVLDDRGLNVFSGTKLVCRAPNVTGDKLLWANADSVGMVAQSYMDGTGVMGVVKTLSTHCEGRRPITEPAPVSAVAEAGAVRWVARIAPLGPGPSPTGESAKLIRDSDAALSLFVGTDHTPSSMVATADRALVVANSGSWELWNAKSRIATGEASSDGVAWRIPGVQVAVGRDLLLLDSGDVIKDALPDSVVAIQPGGQLWVLGDSTKQALYLRDSSP